MCVCWCVCHYCIEKNPETIINAGETVSDTEVDNVLRKTLVAQRFALRALRKP